MHVKEGDLNEPEEDERDHGVGCNALIDWDVVWQGEETRPDGTQHDAYGIGSVHGLDGEPENGQDGTGDDGNV